MTRRWIACGLLLFVATLLLAQSRSIGSVGIFTRPPRVWDGRCPADLQFIGTVNANRWPVWIDYRWERSDGAAAGRRRMEVRSAHQRVSDTWRLGRNGQRLVVWERLHVLAPTNVMSREARVNVICR